MPATTFPFTVIIKNFILIFDYHESQVRGKEILTGEQSVVLENISVRSLEVMIFRFATS
jgi:hypothetical protein